MMPDFKRTIRSFVRREGRLTPSQQKALDLYWDTYALSLDAEKYDIDPQKKQVIDIGFGRGESLFELAKQHPEIQFLGIEVHRPGLGWLFNQLHKAELTNVSVYSHDAVEVLKQCIPAEKMDAVLLFFPDPWPKKRHHKRRLVQPAFIELVASVLKPGGVFHIATDWDNYAEHIQETMMGMSQFQKGEIENTFLERPSTKYEQRGKRLGHTLRDLIYIKK